jgi:Ca-activated chloride channel family protein
MSRHSFLLSLAALLALALSAFGDAGVLLPRGRSQPDPSILSLDEMDVTVRIDNGDARVFIEQIFANHTAFVQEGTYVFALPSRATVSDFAVWDGPVRIPAVILERKRAREIYNALAQQAIDPGLLEMGENASSSQEAGRGNLFTAKITPIPAYGTKRLEIEYHQKIPVENLQSFFALPLHPSVYHAQVAGRLAIHFELDSPVAIRDFRLGSALYPLQYQQQNAHRVIGAFQGSNVTLNDDLSVHYSLDPAAADSARVLTYRNPNPQPTAPTEMAPAPSSGPEPGFFETSALLGYGAHHSPNQTAAARPPHTLVLLFDTSLSMQWDKLDRSFTALDKLLHSLRPADRFNLLLFNTHTTPFRPAPVPATPLTIEKALRFVRASDLRGGTNLAEALQSGLAQSASSAGVGERDLVLLSDGGATRGPILDGPLTAGYAAAWKKLPPARRPRTYVFAVGDDANLPLLKLLVKNEGVLESVLSTEPIEFKLDAFLSKIGRSPVASLRMDAASRANLSLVYRLENSTFPGSVADWVGQYHRPERNVSFDVSGVRDGSSFRIHAAADLPAQSLAHPQLPRLWARARVDALLEKIARQGEDEATIDEIIRLSRKYKFVTPYTSFLAVPRALLRPRVIRPGDPVLRVHADKSIVSVIAFFPFGLIRKLRYLRQQDVWETRFLAPPTMRDGSYPVRLILRDRNGNTYREAKTFVIDSTPPTIRIRLPRRRFHRGESFVLKVSASRTTRTLAARLEGAGPIFLHWNSQARVNTGQLTIPADLPAGDYQLTVMAEDVAHNTASREVKIEVVP